MITPIQRLERMRESFEANKIILAEDYRYFTTPVMPNASIPQSKAEHKSAERSERQLIIAATMPNLSYPLFFRGPKCNSRLALRCDDSRMTSPEARVWGSELSRKKSRRAQCGTLARLRGFAGGKAGFTIFLVCE